MDFAYPPQYLENAQDKVKMALTCLETKDDMVSRFAKNCLYKSMENLEKLKLESDQDSQKMVAIQKDLEAKEQEIVDLKTQNQVLLKAVWDYQELVEKLKSEDVENLKDEKNELLQALIEVQKANANQVFKIKRLVVHSALCSRNFQIVKLRLDCWNLIILPTLRFYVKLHFRGFKQSINVNCDNFRGSEFWF